MNRRDLIALGASAGLMAAAQRSFADAPKPEAKRPPARPDPRAALLDALAACLTRSALCLAHCEAQLATGNKDFARCASAVADMLAIGPGVQAAVARKSPLARKAVELCVAACKECSKACAEHKPHFAHGMHLECKECLEACEACDRACAVYLAA